MMTGEIPGIVFGKLQKVSTQFNESQQQLANFYEAKRAFKELVEAHKNKITALEKTVKALDKKN